MKLVDFSLVLIIEKEISGVKVNVSDTSVVGVVERSSNTNVS